MPSQLNNISSKLLPQYIEGISGGGESNLKQTSAVVPAAESQSEGSAPGSVSTASTVSQSGVSGGGVSDINIKKILGGGNQKNIRRTRKQRDTQQLKKRYQKSKKYMRH